MIDYENKYINLVVLGSFNPAILTHEFLVRECGFDLRHEPNLKGPTIPVVASLEYDNITFFADLGRMQITERDCEKPKSSKIPDYTQTYLEKLPYTPISKCGANFSYTLNIDKSRLSQINDWLSSKRGEFCKVLQSDCIGLEISFELENDKQVVKGWTLRNQQTDHNTTTILKVIYPETDNQVKVDFNFEVNDLDKDRKRLQIITAKYNTVFNIFQEQIEKIFSG